MAVLSDYTSGTISLAQGSVTVTGTGTLFEVTRFREGDTLQIQNLTAVIASVDSDTSLMLTEPWTGATIVDGPYRARQLGDVSRYPTQAATIIDLLGNGVLTNIAEIPVEEGKLLRGNAAGQYEAVPEEEIGIQDPNGSLAKLAALTLAANKTLVTDGNGDIALSNSENYNWIINGNFLINQRRRAKKPANGIYGFDRWKGHANGIEQIVEALPSGEYTLTWTGGGNGTFGGITAVSPIKATIAGGNISVVVPQNATKVSLVAGDATNGDPWQNRSIPAELILCLQYYCKTYSPSVAPGSLSGEGQIDWPIVFTNGPDNTLSWGLPLPMRASPTIVFYSPTTGNANEVHVSGGGGPANGRVVAVNNNTVTFSPLGTMITGRRCILQFTADAEL